MKTLPHFLYIVSFDTIITETHEQHDEWLRGIAQSHTDKAAKELDTPTEAS